MKKLLVKRDDTGLVKQCEFTDKGDIIYNLIEKSRSLLKFSEDEGLCAYLDKTGNLIKDTTPLGEFPENETFIVKLTIQQKFKEDETKTKEKEERNREQNEKDRKEKRAAEEKEAKQREAAEEAERKQQIEEFEKKLQTPYDAKPCPSIDALKQLSQSNSIVLSTLPSDDKETIPSLNKKLTAIGPTGFVYKIIPDGFIDLNESKCKELSFQSEKERVAETSNRRSINTLVSMHGEYGYPALAVSVSGSINTSSSYQ